MRSIMLKYFKGSIVISILGLLTVFFVILNQRGQSELAFQAVFTATLLAVLEISLSFDNAVVNATVMKTMSEVWKKRFLTWGMLIAVFGMRLIFPLIIVSLLAKIDPISALKLSIYQPEEYAKIMTSSHVYVSSFGGMFLLLVGIHFFINEEKDEHWLRFIEKRLAKAAVYKGIELVLALIALVVISRFMPDQESERVFLFAGVLGVICFLAVHGLSHYLEEKGAVQDADKAVASAGFGTFLYLEVLDASFSFDGVIGAFALTSNLVIIMIGLGIGAFFVRSLTIYFVEKHTIEQFKYLEHGAFYAIALLAMIMLLDPLMHIPEWFVGLSGAIILAISVVASIHSKRKALHSVK